jgi:hypothetical protein
MEAQEGKEGGSPVVSGRERGQKGRPAAHKNTPAEILRNRNYY